MKTIHGAPSFTHREGCTSVALTETGGHLTAEFTLPDGRVIAPYSLSPWTPDEAVPDLPPILAQLRGDFLCLPFGPQEDGPPHGETANAKWVAGAQPLHFHMAGTSDTNGSILKIITLDPDHTALYIEHRITLSSGRWSYGSHPILDFSDLPDGTGRVTTSPFRWASTYPGLFSDPANKEYQSLQPNAGFSDLSKVPLAPEPPTTADSDLAIDDLETTDLTRYPARPGHDDLIMLVSESATSDQPFAWTAAVLDGYVWFCLKNPADFPATLFWISNGGRHGAPWNGIHTKRLGLEEVCSHFGDSVDVSREDRLAELGIPTTREFHSGKPTCLPLIQAVAPVPADFGAVASITPVDQTTVRIASDRGQSVETPCNWRFVVPQLPSGGLAR